MWFFPWLTYAAIALMVVVIGAMAFVKDVRSQLIPSLISPAVVLVAARLRQRRVALTTKGGPQAALRSG